MPGNRLFRPTRPLWVPGSRHGRRAADRATSIRVRCPPGLPSGHRLIRFQLGVELGKSQAMALLPVLTADTSPAAQSDSSTDALVRPYREERGRGG